MILHSLGHAKLILCYTKLLFSVINCIKLEFVVIVNTQVYKMQYYTAVLLYIKQRTRSQIENRKMDTNSFFFIIFSLYSLSYYVDGSGTFTGGVSEVKNEKDRSYYASKALQELEKSSDNSNARKIVEVSIAIYRNQ